MTYLEELTLTQMESAKFMETMTSGSAFSCLGEVVDFAQMLVSSADMLHSGLKRLTASPGHDSGLAYSVLTEEYALRARANILFHDAPRHITTGTHFNQTELIGLMGGVKERLEVASSLQELLAIVTNLVTFASAVSYGNAKVLDFLAHEISEACLP